MEISPILELENFELTLDDQEILRKIHMTVPRGKLTAIIGPSGAGKSSLLKSMVRLLPARGKLLIAGKKYQEFDIQELRRTMVYVSQKPVVFPGTVEENIAWGQKLWQLKDPKLISDLLEMVGLENKITSKGANILSVGQQQRVHLARSLAIDPKILLLDEPASSLDAISKEVFESLIKNLQTMTEMTIVMITHDLNQAKRMADYAVLLDEGTIKYQAVAEVFFQEIENLSEAEMLKSLLKKEEVNDV